MWTGDNEWNMKERKIKMRRNENTGRREMDQKTLWGEEGNIRKYERMGIKNENRR